MEQSQLLQLARDAAGNAATSVEQAIDWLVMERDHALTEMERWRAEARRLGSTMEAWPDTEAKKRA